MRTRGLACLTVGIALFAATGIARAAAPATTIPSQTSDGLKQAVSDWIQKLADGSKNEHGKPTKRGHFSRDFAAIGDGAYQVTAHVETAGEETKTTERFRLTLKPVARGFEVAAQELQDTYAGMHRETVSTCRPFETFAFHREGIRLDGSGGSGGSVCIHFYRGRPGRFSLQAPSMTYSYEPPEHAQAQHLNPDFHSIFPAVRKNHERELAFTPAAFLFVCDPATCERLLAEQFTGLSYALPSAAEAATAASAPAWARPLYQAWEEDRRENPFVHFATPVEAGNVFWQVFVAREVAPFGYPGSQEFEDLADFSAELPGSGVSLTYDNWEGWELEFSVWPRRLDIPDQLFSTVYGYYSEETLAATDPYELERRDDKYARWHHVYSVKGSVDMGVEDPEMLAAQIEFGIELKQPLRELPFFIQSIPRREFTGRDRTRELYVNSVQLDGQDVTWTRTSQLGGLVVLPREMPAGSKLNMRMDFKTKALYKINPSFTYVSRFGWMPFVRFADFIDEFELTIRSPTGYKVLGIGHKASERTEGNLVVTHWKADSPVVFPSITFGRYEEDGPGKGFKPALKLDGETVIPVTVHVDKSSFTDWGIKPASLRPLAQQAVNSINLFREISGVDYPYGELNFVNDPQLPLYGQAPSSLIYLGWGVFRGEGYLATRPGIRDATAISKFLRSVVSHEVGHQWWGSRVSNANGRNYWFVESLAEYFSGLFLEFVEGRRQYDEQVEEWRRTILDRRLKSSVQNASSIWSGEDNFGSYQAAVYNKGPYAFHMLREIFKGEGPPGPQGADKKFFEFLKQFSQELSKKREIVTLDIQHAAEKALGGIDPEGNPYNVDLAWFFDQWIRGAGTPQYRLLYDVRQTEDGGWLIEGSVEQRVLVGSSRERIVVDGSYYRGVVNVTVLAKGQEYRSRLVLDGPTTPFKLKVQDKPVEVALNKHNEILAHDVLVNRTWD